MTVHKLLKLSTETIPWDAASKSTKLAQGKNVPVAAAVVAVAVAETGKV